MFAVGYAPDVKPTLYTRHAIRVMVHLAANPGRLSPIGEIAQNYGMSHNHLMKVVHDLRRAGFVEAVRGRSGGIRLARPASEITLGDVVRYTEARPAGSAGDDGFLEEIFEAAFGSFFAQLDGNSLSDIAEVNDPSGTAGTKSLH